MTQPNDKLALVTGAYGFLGRHIARYLAAAGFKVIGLGHGPRARTEDEWAGEGWREWGLSEWHQCDVTLENLRTRAGRPAAVFHCAGGGSVGASLESPADDFKKAVLGTLEVLEYIRPESGDARDACGAKLVYPSSAAVYGNAREQPIGEEAELAPVSPYGEHKKLTEGLIESYCRHFGVKAGIIRFFSLYGPELRKQLLWDTCQRAANIAMTRREPFHGTGDETRDWLKVEDAASLSLAVMEQASQKCPVFNGGSGESASVRQIIEEVFHQICPGVAVHFNNQTRSCDPTHYLANITKAKRLMSPYPEQVGWTPSTDWRDGVTEYVQWFQRALVVGPASR